MAKDKNGTTKLRNILYIIATYVSLAVIFGSGVLAWANLGNKIEGTGHCIEQIEEDAAELETDGCDPAQKNTTDILLMRKDVQNVQKTQAEMRIEQRAGIKAILDRLPEK